jgi:hemerythrin-like domain-containing protein
MARSNKLGQLLHEEHFHIVMLFCDLENRVGGSGRLQPLDPADAEDRRQLTDLITALDGVVRHNAFEEKELFPLLCSSGAEDLAEMLADEHLVMVPLVQRLRRLAGDLLEGGVDAEKWQTFCQTASEFTAEILSHLQKEELGVVQVIDSLLDHHQADALAHRYIHAGETAALRVRAPATD